LWICFSFKKVDRRSAIIHVLTKTPPTQGSRKVVRFMQKGLRIYFVQSSTDECKYLLLFKVNIKNYVNINAFFKLDVHMFYNLYYSYASTLSS